MKPVIKKRRQHYVWRAYLEAWATEGRLYCLRDGKVFRSNLTGVAVERDFYRPRPIRVEDIALLEELIIKRSPPFLQELHRPLVAQFAHAAEMLDRLEAEPDSADKRAAQAALHNMEEDLHQRIEEQGLPLLAALRAGDASFFETESGALAFNYFLATQHTRTKRMRETIVARLADIPNAPPIDRIWNVLSHILATNTAASLYGDRRNFRMQLLENETPTPFITGDQPAINPEGTGSEPPLVMSLFYPVSPTRAVLLTEAPAVFPVPRQSVTEAGVQRWNGLMHDKALEQLFSNSEATLCDLATTVR